MFAKGQGDLMKYLLSGLVLSVALTNIGCPNNNNPGQPASVVGTPTTQCLSTIPTGPNGTGYPQQYPYGGYGGYNSSCAYGYGNNPYYYSQNGYGMGMCRGLVPVYNRLRGVACISPNLLGNYNFLAYNVNGWGYQGYYGYSAWNSNYAMVSCIADNYALGCRCVTVGYGYGVCASF